MSYYASFLPQCVSVLSVNCLDAGFVVGLLFTARACHIVLGFVCVWLLTIIREFAGWLSSVFVRISSK
jgi:hypothetical protein